MSNTTLPWPLSQTGSTLCPVPDVIGFVTPFPNRWFARFPLVKIIWNEYPIPRPHNKTSAFSAEEAMQQALTLLGAFYSNNSALVTSFVTSSDPTNTTATTIAPPPPPLPSFIWPTVVNANFCAYGYTFILEAVTGYLLALIAMACFLALVCRTSRHSNRKLLFFLLFTVGVTRGLFGHLAANRIAMVDSYLDMNHYIGWFFDWTIPLSMLGDLLMSYLDFLLTFFWLKFIAPRWSRSHWGTFVPVACVLLTLLIALVVFLTDWHLLHSDADDNGSGSGSGGRPIDGDRQDYNGGNIYMKSLAYISCLLVVSSALHSVVVVKLLRDLITHQAALDELSPKMRKNMTAVGVIGLLSVLSGIIRGIVLFGHISGAEVFRDGTFSFNNPEFFTVYLIGFMNMPCLAICIAFFVLSWRLLSSGEGEGGGADSDDDGAYSVASEGDGVRISLIAGRYAHRMNSSFGQSGTLSGGRLIGESFSSAGGAYEGNDSNLASRDLSSDTSAGKTTFNLPAEESANSVKKTLGPTSSVVDAGMATPVRSSHSSRALATSAAMFAGTRGPGAGFIISSGGSPGNTPHGSRTRREMKSDRSLQKDTSAELDE